MAVTGHYDYVLVALSYVVSVLGAYTALDLADRSRSAKGFHARWWLIGAGFAMGSGIWAMHFVGMLAFKMNMPVSYDITITLLSLALPIAVTGMGMFAVDKMRGKPFALATGGLLMGLGIVSMHYLGMAGMQMAAIISYNKFLVALSVVIAIAASTTALWLTNLTDRMWQKLLSALVMGLAVVSMHYTGMAAASFIALDNTSMPMPIEPGLAPDVLATMVSLATTCVLAIALGASLVDRRNAALRHAEEETRYRAVVDTAVDPIIIVDEFGSIRSFNRAAEKTFGYSANDVTGQKFTLLMPDLYRLEGNDFSHNWHDRSTNNKLIIGPLQEASGVRKDGTRFPVELSLAEWRVGQSKFLTGILRDITERKAFETALLNAKQDSDKARIEAEKANMAKSKFLAAASHDLRQPLQSLFFFTQVLVEQRQERHDNDVIENIQQSLEAMKMLLDGLLDISKLDAQVVKPEPKVLELGNLLSRLATEYRPRAQEKGLHFITLPTSLRTRSDPSLLERILRNLLENAIKYTESGRILLGCRKVGTNLRIYVIDTGIGFPEERVEELFEEFVQLHNPERDRQKGLGLELAIVKKLTTLLGHRLLVKSTPGKGSSFCIEVPAYNIKLTASPGQDNTRQSSKVDS